MNPIEPRGMTDRLAENCVNCGQNTIIVCMFILDKYICCQVVRIYNVSDNLIL